MKRVLVIAVHPDDETLACGGTLLRHKHDGDRIHWLIATEPKEDAGFGKAFITRREEEMRAVRKLYGFAGVYRPGFPAKGADRVATASIVGALSAVFEAVRPEVVYLPFAGDAHSDHRILFEAAYSCTKVFRHPYVKQVLAMETISETEFAPVSQKRHFLPNYFVDITRFMEKKLRIMRCYHGEMRPHPFPRSAENIKALATFRGAMAGVRYAESFMLLKHIR